MRDGRNDAPSARGAAEGSQGHDSYAPGIAEGDYVTPKTVLGYVGTSGNAQGTPPHLHFGVYTPTGPIDPLPLLTDRTEPEKSQRKQGTANSKRKIGNRR